MRISTWPGIWGNYIFKVEQANVFKVDSICKLLDLFLFLHIDVCVWSPLPSPADKEAEFNCCIFLLPLPSHSLQEELLLLRHSILRKAYYCRRGILFWVVPNSIQSSLNSTRSWRSATQAAKDQLAGMNHCINISKSFVHGIKTCF